MTLGLWTLVAKKPRATIRVWSVVLFKTNIINWLIGCTYSCLSSLPVARGVCVRVSLVPTPLVARRYEKQLCLQANWLILHTYLICNAQVYTEIAALYFPFENASLPSFFLSAVCFKTKRLKAQSETQLNKKQKQMTSSDTHIFFLSTPLVEFLHQINTCC